MFTDVVRKSPLVLSALVLLTVFLCFPLVTEAEDALAHSFGSDRAEMSGPNNESAGGAFDYEQIPLYRLIGIAELVATGEVTSVADSSFAFRIDDVLVGESDEAIIRVGKATFMVSDGPRTVPYDSGQAFLIFLVKDTRADHKELWLSLGLAGGAEFPLEGGFVYFTGRFVPGLERKDFLVHGIKRSIQRFDASLFKQAVRDYRNCFEWPGESLDAKRIPERLCNDSLLADYCRQSSMHDYLARETVKRVE